jgi:biopolymer transport protein ExbD
VQENAGAGERKMKLSRKGISPVRLEMTPLMDIIFLLLVFFIYSMMSMTVHHGKQVNLPASSSASTETQEAISITIQSDKDGIKITVDDGEPFTDSSLLTQALEKKKAEAKDGKEPDLQIFADKTVPYQELYKVLDSITQAGLTRISLQATLQQEPVVP